MEKDISQVSVSIQPSIDTLAQKFISPKNKPTISTAFGSSIPKPIISPMNARGPTTSMEKKHPYGRGTSNSAHKAPHHNFVKPSYGGHGLVSSSSVFSPDKRANHSRSQMNNNLYYKRGAKNSTAEGKLETSGKSGH